MLHCLYIVGDKQMDNFATRKLMSWGKIKSGELAIMDNNGNWKSYTALPPFLVFQEDYAEMSKGLRTMQMLLKSGWILVNKEDY